MNTRAHVPGAGLVKRITQGVLLLGWVECFSLPASARDVHVAVYNDVGTGRSITDLMRVLRNVEDVYVRQLTAEEILAGHLREFDLVIHPGGSGSRQGKQLGKTGRDVVRRFVAEGGGFIGVCAGAYLASAHYDWSLHLLDAEVVDRAHWARGTGMVDIGLSDAGRRLFEAGESQQSIYYGQGPLLAPAGKAEIPDFESLAYYQSEIAKNGAPRGVMIGTTAIARGDFGRGKVLCFSPHPEKTPGLGDMFEKAIAFVKQRAPRPVPPPPASLTRAVELTPDISQKRMPNGNYCGPCAVANVLCQFNRQGRFSLPDGFVASPESRRALALALGEKAHMNTLKKNGTDRYRLVNGLWTLARNYTGTTLTGEYLGIRRYDRKQLAEAVRPRLRATVGVPKLRHLQERIAARDGVVILFGSYKPDAANGGRLERVGGHYVAAVGYGINAEGLADPEGVILHDSNDGVTGDKHVQARTVERITELWDRNELLARSRKLVKLKNAPIQKDGRIAFLETIFSFRPRSGNGD